MGVIRPYKHNSSDKLAHLIEEGEVVHRLGRGFAERLHRIAQAAEGFTDGNQSRLVCSAWFILPRS